MDAPLRHPPSIEALLSSPAGRELGRAHGRARALQALRRTADRWRRGELALPEAPEGTALYEALVGAAARELEARPPAGPRPVVNATGVLLHTNLGRAPLAGTAREAVLLAAGFCTLEFDLVRGERGKRGEHVRELLRELFAPGRKDVDALAVTNNAAALLLALDTAANGRPVAVSRGELVAIGGDFRVPSILAKSGATLHEVGTTNKTTRADYEEALAEGAGAILKVHPSNYRIVGFSEEVPLAPLAQLARAYGVPLIFDAGAGAPRRFEEPGLSAEPVPFEALDAGADLVCFSGDKTLGGPQAGILLGRRELVARAAKNPLARALRPDKLALAALAATLDLFLAGREDEIPFFRMLRAPLSALEERGRALAGAARDAGFGAEVVDTEAVAGGGSGAGSSLPSRGIAISHPSRGPDALAEELRRRPLPVIARIANGKVVLDLRSVAPEEDEELVRALNELG